MPSRVLIWRFTDTTLTVTCSDGSCYNTSDTILKGQHEGRWSCFDMRFVPQEDCFSDGSPVSLGEEYAPEHSSFGVIYEGEI